MDDPNRGNELGSLKGKMRGIVRMVAMQQFGQFMMGRARIKGHTITLSGSYGGDGLPVYQVPQEVYDAGVDIPDELFDLWNKGGGWNSAGSEASAMRKWAIETFKVKI
jgi:hypothetical protein